MPGFIKKFLAATLALFLLSGFLICDPAAAEPSVQEQQADLERQLKEIEAQIAQYQQELKGVQGEKIPCKTRSISLKINSQL